MRMEGDDLPRGKTLMAATAFLFAIGMGHGAEAFHAGTIGDCGGCHSTDKASSNIYNLRGTDQSSTCLRCHERRSGEIRQKHHVSTPEADMPRGVPPKELSPGGDFGWLKKNYRDGLGERHGHNIVAVDYAYMADSKPVAPGGLYPSSSLHCTSCHDPHGRYRRNADGSTTGSGLPIRASGSYSNSPDPDGASTVGVYRLLGGIDYLPLAMDGSFAFKASPPAAVSPPAYNRSEESVQIRVAYGAGMSEWCVNCHTHMHGTKMTHPVGNSVRLGARIAGQYNSYVKTGDTSGSQASSYLSLVPYEEGTTDYSVLKARTTGTEGPEPSANVSCLSCHRAHASGWNYMLRFQVGREFITLGDGSGVAVYPDPAEDPELAQGRTENETRIGYYGRPATSFAPKQRSLCDKCHAKD